MSLFDTEKLAQSQKSSLDLLQQIAGKLFEGAEQLGQLQVKTLRASSDAQFESLRKFSAARDPQAFMEWQAALAQPTHQAERVQELSRQVYELVSGTQAEIAKLVERQVEAGTKQAQELVEAVAKNAPAGSESLVAAFKSALQTAGSVYESAQKAAKQASEIAESGVAAAASAAGQATGKASAGTREQS
ncbi:TIGR01841 family phasin [Pseudomonas monteilii]|uniref:TIGR01841 family phasin n=1 Tax=Pseudomonas TaxID=286 RepID=UPI0015E314E2|nr:MULTISPECIES: TIGR01841 family phasin [Pseudomonas]ELS0924930.1 TIGR01841 family phasin [Pseudomonas putida]MBA1316166.1 TIGR01841 family phasin [Pseudomonas monteilii]QUN70621.1 TIGR01841 family phasin [Pseudomonas sp. JS425]